MAAPAIIYVEWVDAVADLGWEDGIKATLHECHTVGYLIDETKDALCIASTWSKTMTNARMHIPKAWIKKRKTLSIENKQRKTKRKTAPAVDQGHPTELIPRVYG